MSRRSGRRGNRRTPPRSRATSPGCTSHRSCAVTFPPRRSRRSPTGAGSRWTARDSSAPPGSARSSPDGDFDPAVLTSVTTLKLSEEEARIVAGGPFDRSSAAALGVPEVLLTLGSHGAVVFADGADTFVPAAWPVLGVQTTGAGDAFMVAYAASRADGRTPSPAARNASSARSRDARGAQARSAMRAAVQTGDGVADRRYRGGRGGRAR